MFNTSQCPFVSIRASFTAPELISPYLLEQNTWPDIDFLRLYGT